MTYPNLIHVALLARHDGAPYPHCRVSLFDLGAERFRVVTLRRDGQHELGRLALERGAAFNNFHEAVILLINEGFTKVFER